MSQQHVKHVKEYASRRFFFSKHYLVLKLDMSQRVRELEEVLLQPPACREIVFSDLLKEARDEGWISPGDVEGLMEDLHERLAHVETYFPSRTAAFFLLVHDPSWNARETQASLAPFMLVISFSGQLIRRGRGAVLCTTMLTLSGFFW
eukprot:1903640-Amphidinium_carterae.1